MPPAAETAQHRASPQPPRPIRRLEPLLVNQIAAGEVIERPASVVKELVENSLDAGATTVRVELSRGGIELVRVTDDGRGIPEDELRLALEPHATSKIAGADDLDRIGTLGFRGEAIASIGSVSRLRIRSRTLAQAGAAEIACEGGEASAVRPASGPVGTCVEARNLFFNTPARRKFLRTPQTEQSRCADWVRDLALAHPAVGFELVADGRSLIDVPFGQGPKARAYALLGKELDGQMIEVSADRFDDARGLSLWGLVGLPSVARATNRAQHMFLNGRTVRDKVLQHALREAYRGLIEPGRHPAAVLMLEMSPEGVDVNVHPAKLEVRFRDQSLVHSVVLRAVRDALRAADLTPEADGALPPGRGGGLPYEILPPPLSGPTSRGAHGRVYVDAADFVETVKSVLAAPQAAGRPLTYEQVQQTLDEQARAAFTRRVEEARGAAPQARAPGVDPEDPGLPRPVATERVLQVHNSYLVTQDESGVLIIDQHALHERVMFEKLADRVLGGDGSRALESQRLLVPAVVDVSPGQVDLVAELEPLCERIGLELGALGPTSVGVHAFPSFLFERGVDPAAFVPELLD